MFKAPWKALHAWARAAGFSSKKNKLKIVPKVKLDKYNFLHLDEHILVLGLNMVKVHQYSPGFAPVSSPLRFFSYDQQAACLPSRPVLQSRHPWHAQLQKVAKDVWLSKSRRPKSSMRQTVSRTTRCWFTFLVPKAAISNWFLKQWQKYPSSPKETQKSTSKWESSASLMSKPSPSLSCECTCKQQLPVHNEQTGGWEPSCKGIQLWSEGKLFRKDLCNHLITKNLRKALWFLVPRKKPLSCALLVSIVSLVLGLSWRKLPVRTPVRLVQLQTSWPGVPILGALAGGTRVLIRKKGHPNFGLQLSARTLEPRVLGVFFTLETLFAFAQTQTGCFDMWPTATMNLIGLSDTFKLCCLLTTSSTIFRTTKTSLLGFVLH